MKYGPEVVKMRQDGHTYKSIMKALGCSKATVAYHCSKLVHNEQIKANNNVLWRDHIRRTLQIPVSSEQMLDWLLEDGVRRTDAADALGLAHDEVVVYAKRRGFKRTVTTGAAGYEYLRRRRRHLKMLAVAYKGGRCVRCGYHRSIRAMDFHHPDPSQKDFSISTNANRAWSVVKLEVEKCVLLCSNCHREEHDRLELYAPSPPLTS